MSPFLLHWIHAYGVAAIFVLLLLGVVGLPVPDETLLTFAGVLVRRGQLHLVPTLLAAALGSIAGITISYGLGRTCGFGVVERYGRWVHVTRADLNRVEAWFERSGRWVLMFGYFIPGIRHFTALVAGSSRLPAAVFTRFAYAGAVLWVLTFITLGWYVGARWEAALEAAHRHLLVVGIAALLVVGTYALLHRLWLRRSR